MENQVPEPTQQQQPLNEADSAAENARLRAIITQYEAILNQSRSKEPRVPLPEKFDGFPQKYRSFINQVELVFLINPDRYRSGATKVATIGTLLTGAALAWFTPYLERKNEHFELLNDYEAFKLLMDRTFGMQDRVRVAATSISKLYQGTGSVSDYAARFRRFAADLEWNDAALIYQFRRGLNDAVKDKMVNSEEPVDLEDAIATAIQWDNRLRERRDENILHRPPIPGMNFRNNTPRNANVSHQTRAANVPSTTITPSYGPQPMELDFMARGPLTEDEKTKRRLQNLCLYCGSSDHFRANCPSLQMKTARLQAMTTSAGQTIPGNGLGQ